MTQTSQHLIRVLHELRDAADETGDTLYAQAAKAVEDVLYPPAATYHAQMAAARAELAALGAARVAS